MKPSTAVFVVTVFAADLYIAMDRLGRRIDAEVVEASSHAMHQAAPKSKTDVDQKRI